MRLQPDAALSAHIARQLAAAGDWRHVYNTVARYRDYLDASHVAAALRALPALLAAAPPAPSTYERGAAEELANFLLDSLQRFERAERQARQQAAERQRLQVRCRPKRMHHCRVCMH